MKTTTLSLDDVSSSVIAVPPLARRADWTLNRDANAALIRHIESGGVKTLLYGGNANSYHVRFSEYAELLTLLCEAAAQETLIIPSVGPAYGTMMDQADVLRDFDFPTVMVLPQRDMTTPEGVAIGVRHFAERLGKPVVLYLKQDGVLPVEIVRKLFDDRLIVAIKYAIVRDDPARDELLRQLVDAIDPRWIVSGIGEQPAMVHLRDFRLGGFTSGCVCVAPRLSMQMLAAIQTGEFAEAERIRTVFRPLEDLRNAIHPVRVLHDAVTLAGIADMGPILPLLSNLATPDRDKVQTAARQLLRCTT